MNTQSVAKPRGGNGMDGGGAISDLDEPGAVDNRLSIDPNAFPTTLEWENGQIYDLTALGAGVKIRQISPGEFEIMPASGVAETVEEADLEANPAMEELTGRYV